MEELEEELAEYVGKEMHFFYTGELDPEHLEEGKGELNSIEKREPGRLTIRPLFYILEARDGDKKELSSSNQGYLVKILGISFIRENPLINGLIYNYNIPTNQDEQTPQEVDLIINGQIPKVYRNIGDISTRL